MATSPFSDPGAVNLYSDTQTRPTPGMRRAIAEAVVGDEQQFADPTTLELERRVAELLGHEAAVFLPSGTMCNEIALRLHVRPGGDEVLAHRTSHIVTSEAGGPAILAGATVSALDGDGGTFTADAVREAVRPPGRRHSPRTRLVCVEQTSNLGGGRVWPLAQIEEVHAAAAEHELLTHLDGARLLNASIASGIEPAAYAAPFTTAWIDFSKGLGAPVGAALAGPAALIEEAWRFKQMWGGAMRQSGVLAAACLYALDHHVARLHEDHENARALAEGLGDLDGVTIDLDAIETNIVFFEVPDAPALTEALRRDGILVGAYGRHRIRAVTHLDVDRAGIERALASVAAHLRAGVAR